MSDYIEEAISEAELMLCPKGLPHTGTDNRAEHGHHDCWVIGELLNEIERLRAALSLACGLLSTYENHSMFHPEQLRQQFLDEAVCGE